MQSISTITVIILISISSTYGQWMQLFDTDLDPFQTLSPLTVSGDLQPPKKEKTIPIIVMLKPKRSKSLTSQHSNIERKGDNNNESQTNFNFNQLLQRFPGLIEHQNIGNNEQPVIDTYETRQTASILPMPANYMPQQNLMLQQMPNREENIHWPTNNDKTISSIDSLLPQFAAISESNQKQLAENLGQNMEGIHSFEDAFKKFTSNLTNLGHSSTDDGLEDRVKENTNEANDETTTHSNQNGKSSNTEQSTTTVTDDSYVNNDDKELLSQTTREDLEQPYSQEISDELVHKPSPLTSNRQRIKAPVIKLNNNNDREIFKGFQPVTNNNEGNEWVPMKSKKSKKRPVKQQQSQQQNRQQLEKPQTTLTMEDLQKNHLFGLPQLQQLPKPQFLQQQQPQQPFLHQQQQPFRGIIRPQKFYATYTTPMMSYQSPQQSMQNILKTASSAQNFNNLNHQGMRANGFQYNSPYFSALEMQGNANKPQHTEPSKDDEDEEEHNEKHHNHNHHDMDEEKDEIKSEKEHHKMNHHKDMITEDKKEGSPEGHVNGDLLNQHLSCCHQLLGQHSPHHLHELTPSIEDDKYIQSLVEEHSPPHHLHHFNRHHNHHHFRNHPHIKFAGHEPCHDEVVLPTHTQYYLPNFPPLPPKPVLPPPITRLHYKPNFSFYNKPSLLWG